MIHIYRFPLIAITFNSGAIIKDEIFRRSKKIGARLCAIFHTSGLNFSNGITLYASNKVSDDKFSLFSNQNLHSNMNGKI